MYNTDNKSSKELWAILNDDEEIMWSRGGSSSSPKLMVFDTEKKAKAGMNNAWFKQISGDQNLTVSKIYPK
jgi:hypothetical protein